MARRIALLMGRPGFFRAMIPERTTRARVSRPSPMRMRTTNVRMAFDRTVGDEGGQRKRPASSREIVNLADGTGLSG